MLMAAVSFLIPGSEKSFTASRTGLSDGTAVFLCTIWYISWVDLNLKKRMNKSHSEHMHKRRETKIAVHSQVTLWDGKEERREETLYSSPLKSALIYLQESSEMLIHPADLIFFSTDDWMHW